MTNPGRDTLTTDRLRLRPLLPADLAVVHGWTSDPAIARYMSWGPNTESETAAFLARVIAGHDFGIELAGEAVLIGSCGIYADAAGDTAELGWILHRDHWNRGYGTEAARELIRYGFTELGLRRIIAPCAAVNTGSWRVMEKSGMRREAVHRKAFWARVDQEWVDEYGYAILAEEWVAPA